MTAAKLVPALATVPLAASAAGGAGYAVFFEVLAVFFVPALLLGGEAFAESFAYHADRGVQVERGRVLGPDAARLGERGWSSSTAPSRSRGQAPNSRAT